MVLDPSGLHADLESFFTAPTVVATGDVVDLPASRSACAQSWADAMQSYTTAIVPVSTAVSAAAATLKTSLEAAFATGSATVAVDAAFQAFAATVGIGMVGFTATPPPSPPGFVAHIATIQPSHAAAATAWSGWIDTWMRTGTAVPSGGGPAVGWT